MRNANQLIFAEKYKKRQRIRDPSQKNFGNTSRCRSHYKRELVTGTPSITGSDCGRFISGDYPRINLRCLIFAAPEVAVVAPRSGTDVHFRFLFVCLFACETLFKKMTQRGIDGPSRRGRGACRIIVVPIARLRD